MALLLTVPNGPPANSIVELQALPGNSPVRGVVADSTLLAGLTAPLSNVAFVDRLTSVPAANQNGSIAAPFATIQQGIAYVTAAGGGSVYICPGVYAEALTTSVGLQLIALSSNRNNVTSTTSITVTAGTLNLQGITLITGITGEPANQIFANTCTLGVVTGAMRLTAIECTIGAVTVGSISCRGACSMSGLITLTLGTGVSSFSGPVQFLSAADIVGPGGTSSVLFDAESRFRFASVSNTITTITLVQVFAALARASLSVAVPVLVATAIGEAVAVSTLGTELEGIGTGSAIDVTRPSAGIAGGGACIGWRINASNSIIFQFLGPTTGGAQSFVVSRNTANT